MPVEQLTNLVSFYQTMGKICSQVLDTKSMVCLRHYIYTPSNWHVMSHIDLIQKKDKDDYKGKLVKKLGIF